MSVKLQIIRDGHVVEEYDSFEPLKAMVMMLDDVNKMIEFTAAILMALTLYRAGVRSRAFSIGSLHVRFQGGDDP